MFARPSSPNRVVLVFGPDEFQLGHEERAIELPPGFPYRELSALGAMLEAERVFVPGYFPPASGLCCPDAFIYQHVMEGVQTILLPDRNIVSRMAQIAAGQPMGPMLRKVAGIKAFCHFLDIQIEPSIAFHELAHNQGNAAANAELARFREADNANPYQWLDLVFGDRDALDAVELSSSPSSHDLAFPLRRWRRNYIAALKIAELELSDASNLERMRALLTWMRDDFMIAGPAALLASIYFAPRSPPRKGLFKQLHSPNRDKAIDGVRNAAWDLTHLSDMVQRVNGAGDAPDRLLFASFDERLRILVRLLFSVSSRGDPERELRAALVGWWGASKAKDIAALLIELLEEAGEESRRVRQAGSPLSIDELIELGEQRIRSLV